MAQSFWPGQSFRPSTDFRTGESEVFRQLGNLAATGGDVAVKLYIQQAQDQFSTAQIQIEKAEADYAVALQKERDGSKYPAMLKEYESSVNKFRPKNPLASHDFDSHVAIKSIEWDKFTKAAEQDRYLDNWQVKADEYEKGYIEGTISEALYTKHLEDGIPLYNLDKSQILARIEKARHVAEQRKAENAALINPEEFLKKVKGNKIEGFPLLTPGDVQDLRSTALGEIGFRRSQEDAALSSFYTDISEKAEQGMPFDQLRDSIRNQPGISVEEREKAMNVARGAYRTWEDGGTKEDAWKTTQDYNALMRMQIKISSGQPVTEMDILRAQMARPSEGPLFSNADRNNLFSQLPDSGESYLKTPVSKQWLADVDDMFMDDAGLVESEDREQWMKTRNGVTEIIRINHPDVGKTQKEIDAFLEPAKKSITKELLSLLYSPYGFGLRRWRERNDLNTGGIIRVGTREEAKKLDPGTKFMYQGQIYTRN